MALLTPRSLPPTAPLPEAPASPRLTGRVFTGSAAPWLVALLTLALVWGYWFASARVRYHDDLTGHINVGRLFLNKSPEKFPPAVQVQRHVGFDGQFFLFLACDPFLRQASTLKRLDSPMLRARRIGYPLLVWALARGHAARTPWIMFWVCAISSALVTGFLAALMRRNGGSPALALLFPLSYTTIMCYHWLTSENLALALVAGSLLSLERERPRLALALAMAAGLTKEVALLWPLAVAGHALWRRDWRRAGLFSLAPLPLLAWMLYLRCGVKLDLRVRADASNLGFPFTGAILQLAALIQGRTPAGGHDYAPVDALVILVVLAAPFVAMRRLARERSAEALALSLAALLAVSLPAGPWWDGNNFTRQSFLLFLLLFVASARDWPRKTPEALLAALSALAGAAYLIKYLVLR